MERVILPGVNQYGAPALPLKYIAVNPQIVVIVRVTIYRLTTFLKVLMPILLVTRVADGRHLSIREIGTPPKAEPTCNLPGMPPVICRLQFHDCYIPARILVRIMGIAGGQKDPSNPVLVVVNPAFLNTRIEELVLVKLALTVECAMRRCHNIVLLDQRAGTGRFCSFTRLQMVIGNELPHPAGIFFQVIRHLTGASAIILAKDATAFHFIRQILRHMLDSGRTNRLRRSDKRPTNEHRSQQSRYFHIQSPSLITEPCS